METGINYINIFYAVASLAIVIITTGIVYIFKEFIPLLRDLRDISRKIRKESSFIIDDVESVRTGIHRIIGTLLKLINFKKK